MKAKRDMEKFASSIFGHESSILITTFIYIYVAIIESYIKVGNSFTLYNCENSLFSLIGKTNIQVAH